MRSKLFVPGSRPELFDKAMKGAADALSFDLEDSVDEHRKAEARTAVARFLRTLPEEPGKTIIVRVNGLGTSHFAADIEAVVGPGVDLVNLPKPESAADVCACADAIERAERGTGHRAVGILANIESPRALRLASEIATASPRVAGLQVGWADLLEPLNIDRGNSTAIESMQLTVRLAAGEAGIWAYDGAYPHIGDLDGFRREAEAARRLGYLGKSAIHPSQVSLANDVFQPTADEIAEALAILDAAESAARKGVGAFRVGNRMIDAPFVRRAEAVVAAARRLGLAAPEHLRS
jgi:citrate lyase subunit beta / citryl-CoA lyase